MPGHVNAKRRPDRKDNEGGDGRKRWATCIDFLDRRVRLMREWDAALFRATWRGGWRDVSADGCGSHGEERVVAQAEHSVAAVVVKAGWRHRTHWRGERLLGCREAVVGGEGASVECSSGGVTRGEGMGESAEPKRVGEREWEGERRRDRGDGALACCPFCWGRCSCAKMGWGGRRNALSLQARAAAREYENECRYARYYSCARGIVAMNDLRRHATLLIENISKTPVTSLHAVANVCDHNSLVLYLKTLSYSFVFSEDCV